MCEGSSPPLILPLSTPDLPLAMAGGKGKNLCCMIRAGLPVPTGFVVTTSAYQAFTATNNFDDLLNELWERLESGDAAGLNDASKEIRRILTQLHFFTRMRDNGQSYVVKLLLPLRRLYAELGRRWTERGWLRDRDDFFFLVQEEIEAVNVVGDPQSAGLDLQARAEARRQAHDYWHSQPLCFAVDRDGRPVEDEAEALDPNATS